MDAKRRENGKRALTLRFKFDQPLNTTERIVKDAYKRWNELQQRFIYALNKICINYCNDNNNTNNKNDMMYNINADNNMYQARYRAHRATFQVH